ncbi:Shedu anti-phage system protein SduA domain-containing protein [Methanospirillum stamsii]|uniref:Shedu protein SduA C-terminal domain-containing protein n=1 Tax=Methanospirillum stamsii TaxID=1277351 RepID=A0A2V2NLT1_9EURY|nr:Shedu anti-phage system protein SduA domain-containing protein [Methanospirillum stamsii]PWR76283.1 hypothetical protein DLD82_00290 [Methanospirillum stamsii]
MQNDNQRNLLSKTYNMATPPEMAMRWEEYENLIFTQWQELLNHNPKPSEIEIQSFLEQYPSLVPGAYNIVGGESGHPPTPHGLISQPTLPSYHSYIPDFLWISHNSSCVEPVFIEIESPKKRWFTNSGTFSQDFNQALGQLEDWRVWIKEPINQISFKSFYGLDKYPYNERAFVPYFVLIYGRREEATSNPNWNKKRHEKEKDDLKIMTFDRLTPHY